jgi:threonine dehydrogenase-like Zn-dependent dehydrogenase
MRAAVTESKASMRIVDMPDPGDPGDGEVVIRPEAVGLCGSDFHYFLGHIGSVEDSQLYPRVLGHEAAGTVEAVGPGCPPHLRVGERVAMWPLVACGHCYPCRIRRENACANISLIGVHIDGALQERLRIPASQVFPVGDREPALAALIEPVSIAVRAVVRGRVAEGEKVVVFGAGPIGQAIAVAAIDRGASVLLVDRVQSRLERGKAIGADVLTVGEGDDRVAAALEWAGSDGPEVVYEATGAAEVARTAVELVAQAGRVVVVGLGSSDVPLRVSDLAFKEIDLLGVSCCNGDEFAEAVALVARREDALRELVTHEYPLEETPAAIEYAIRHPAEVMKAVIRLEAS